MERQIIINVRLHPQCIFYVAFLKKGLIGLGI